MFYGQRAILFCFVCVLANCLASACCGEDTAVAKITATNQFDTTDEGTFNVSATGVALKRKRLPRIDGGQLILLESWAESKGSVAFEPISTELLANIEFRWRMTMNTGTEGAGMVWLAVEPFGSDPNTPEFTSWQAPNFAGSFGIGFDARNPPNRDPFSGSGNVYDRPQHEISLHWNDREIVKKSTRLDFRDEEPHQVVVQIHFVTGGAEVTVHLDDEAVFHAHFIPGMTAYVGRVAFGATNRDTAGDVLLDDVQVSGTNGMAVPTPPTTIVAIDHKLNDAKNHRNEAPVAFPKSTDKFGRIICTLRLDKPETRFDPWDRIAHVFIYDNDERFELLRYITPYDRGYEWKIDVSDFRPLLRGQRRIEQVCETYGEGWVVTVKFDFYEGPTENYAYRVLNIWSGSPEIGNPDKPVQQFYDPRSFDIDKECSSAKVRMVVTGHGMSPNSENAAEFMPIGRTLTINGQSHRNKLWKTDNYLNPCRPQGGTWKYNRAGWAPGDVVRPWEVWIDNPADEDGRLRIEYQLDNFVNENRGQTWAPTHRTEAQLILLTN